MRALRPSPVLAALALLLAVPAPAHAGNLTRSGTTLNYAAVPGEANRVVVIARLGLVTVSDGGATVTGCTPVSQREANCQGRFARVRLRLGNGRDTAVVRGIGSVADGGGDRDFITGGALRDELNGGTGGDVLRGLGGNDTLYGEAGDDRLFGGAGGDFLDGDFGDDVLTGGSGKDTSLGFVGRDFLDTADGVRETADCGTQTDRARVDLRDRIQFCERVIRIRGLGP